MVAIGVSSAPGGFYDPMKAVKRLHLELIQRLDIARIPHHALSTDDVDSACDAAKTLRNRIIREYERVRTSLQKIKQRLYSSGGSDLREAGGGNVEGGDDEDGALPPLDSSANAHGPLLQQRLKKAIAAAIREDQTATLHRAEFLFLGELHMVQRVLVPVLVTHALHHAHTLLPQLLKLLAAMTLPILSDAPDVTQQQDVFNDIRTRCASDEFFVLLIHAVAPVASLRKDGPLPGADAILLEVVLNIMSNMLQGPVALVEPMVGAMCRNHGVELVLVLLTQNFDKFQTLSDRPPAASAAAAAQRETNRNDDDSDGGEYSGDEEEEDGAPEHGDAGVTIQDKIAYDEAVRASAQRRDQPPPEAAPANIIPDVNGAAPPPPSSFAMQRNETQLVVLADSQYEAYLENEVEEQQQQNPLSGRRPPPTTGVDDVILYTDGGEAVVVAARPSSKVPPGASDNGEEGRTAPPSCYGNEVVGDDDGIDIDFNAPPPPMVDEEQGSSDGDADDDDDAASEGPTVTVTDRKPNQPEPSSDSEASAVGSEDDEEEEEDAEDADEEDEDEEDFVVLDDDEALIDKNPRLKELAQDLQRETLETLRRWNDYLLEIVALVFRCAPAADVSMLALSLRGNSSMSASIQTLQTKVAAELQRQRQVESNWRLIAKSRNGAFATNSILVRKMPPPAPGERERRDDEPPRPALAVLGATSSLMMGKRINALDFVKEQDRKKRGRFQKKMLEPAKPVSVLPLPTQIHLAQQFSAFLAHGFERISTMLWPNIHAQLKRLDAEITEMCEAAKVVVLAIDGPMISPLHHIDVKEIMNYLFLCSTLLRFTRENLQHVLDWRKEMALRKQRRQQQRQATTTMMPPAETMAMMGPHVSFAGHGDAPPMGTQHTAAQEAQQHPPGVTNDDDDDALDEEQQELLMTFEAQWKAVSHIITLDHIQAAFTLMSNFTINKELATEYDVGVPIALVAELVLLLVHLLDGDIVQDASVTMAAHAMGSSLLYHEENIQTVYRLIGQLSFKARPAQSTTQPLILLLHALLTLIEKCSFNGSLALPKKAQGTSGGRKGKGRDGEDDVLERSSAVRDGLVEDDVADDAFVDEENDENDDEGSDDADDHHHAQHSDFIVPDGADDDDDGTSPLDGEVHHRPGADNENNAADAVPKLRLGEEEVLDGEALVQQMRLQDEQLQQGRDGTSGAGDASDVTEVPRVQQSPPESVTGTKPMATSEPSMEGKEGVDPVAYEGIDDEGGMDEAAAAGGDGEDEHDDDEEEQRLFNALRSRSQESEESASIVLSSRTGHSSFTSEREVQVQDFYIRLATPRYIPLLYFALSTWRSNDLDTNLALAAILDNFLGRSLGISSVFSFPFLLIFHEILSTGYETHRPLYDIADRIVYQFFNPTFAKSRRPLFPGGAGATAGGVSGEAEPVEEGGAMSSFGTEVAFRCTRALFLLHPSHYMVLEDAGTAIAMPNFEEESGRPEIGVRKTKKVRGKTTTFQLQQGGSDDDDDGGASDHDDDDQEYQLDVGHAGQQVSRKKRSRRATTTGDGTMEAASNAAPRRASTRRKKSDATNIGGETMAYVMGSADVTALAKEVDRKERQLKAQAKRQPRRKRQPRSDDDDDEVDNSLGEEDDDGSDAPLALRHPNTKPPKKKKHRVDNEATSHRKNKSTTNDDRVESPHAKKQRKRQEKKRDTIRRRNALLGIPNDGDDNNTRGEVEAPYPVGSIITHEDGGTYMVHDDGFAYQVVVDATTGTYVFVDGDEAAGREAEDGRATASNDGADAVEREADEYRREEDARIAALHDARLIDAPHDDGTPSTNYFTSPQV